MTTRFEVVFAPDISSVKVLQITADHSVNIEKQTDRGYVLIGDIRNLLKLVEDPAIKWFTPLDQRASTPPKGRAWRNEKT